MLALAVMIADVGGHDWMLHRWGVPALPAFPVLRAMFPGFIAGSLGVEPPRG